MVHRREILKSAVVLATGGLPYVDLAAAAPGEVAETLLRNVVESYSSMTSYEDNGTVKRLTGDVPPYQTDFATLYKSPTLFRFEFSRPHPYPPLNHVVTKHVVGFDGSVPYSVTRSYEGAPRIEAKENLDLAIAGATGVSSGSAHTIGRLLLRGVTGLSILDLVDARLNEDTVIDGTKCYSLSAQHPKGGERLLWIEKETLLIRQIRTSHGTESGRFSDEVRENIRVNQPVDDALFAVERRDQSIDQPHL